MKIFKFGFCMVVSSALFFASCSTSHITISENEPVAIISVIGNSAIPWASDGTDDDDDDGNGILSNAVNKFIDGKNPEYLTGEDRVNYAEESFRDLLSDISGAKVLDKDEVLQSEAYEDLSSSIYNMFTSTVRATGYKDLTTIGAKKARVLMEAIGAESLVLLNFDFHKQLVNGSRQSGVVQGLVSMKVRVLNRNGKEILNKTITKTTESLKIKGRSYNKDEFVGLFPDAIDNAIRDCIVTYMLGE